MSEQSASQFDIDAFLKHLTERPGVYQMLDAEQIIIYVGKAKNLKRRVSSYFKKRHTEIKTEAMVAQVAHIDVTVTDTESEALILENTLIKRHKPKYNILFRDDKSYPYIFVSTAKKYPALSYHRGAKDELDDISVLFPMLRLSIKLYKRSKKSFLFANVQRVSLTTDLDLVYNIKLSAVLVPVSLVL